MDVVVVVYGADFSMAPLFCSLEIKGNYHPSQESGSPQTIYMPQEGLLHYIFKTTKMHSAFGG